jgi:hypothetical protein
MPATGGLSVAHSSDEVAAEEAEENEARCRQRKPDGTELMTSGFVFMALNAHALRTSTLRIVERIMRVTGGLIESHIAQPFGR